MTSRLDRRMAEIRADRGDLDRIEESTATITKGTSDPLNWILGIASIVLIPVTGGLSLGLGVIAILRATKGGKANLQAIQPTTADLASPGYGCVRILSALGVLIVLAVLAALFLAAVAYNAGVQP